MKVKYVALVEKLVTEEALLADNRKRHMVTEMKTSEGRWQVAGRPGP